MKRSLLGAAAMVMIATAAVPAADDVLRTQFFRLVRSNALARDNEYLYRVATDCSDPQIRQFSRKKLNELRLRGSEPRMHGLLRRLRDDRPKVRRAAALAIAKVGPRVEHLEPLLLIAAGDANPSVRSAVETALAKTQYAPALSNSALKELNVSREQLGLPKGSRRKRSRQYNLQLHAPDASEWEVFLNWRQVIPQKSSDILGADLALIQEMIQAYTRKRKQGARSAPQRAAITQSIAALTRLGQTNFEKLFEIALKSRKTSLEKFVTVADFNPAILAGYIPESDALEQVRKNALSRIRRKGKYVELINPLFNTRDRMSRTPAHAQIAARRYSPQDSFPLCVALAPNALPKNNVRRQLAGGAPRGLSSPVDSFVDFQLPRSTVNRVLLPMLNDADRRVRTAAGLAYAIHGNTEEFVRAALIIAQRDEQLPNDDLKVLLDAIQPGHTWAGGMLVRYYAIERADVRIRLLDTVVRLKRNDRDMQLFLLDCLADANLTVATQARLLIQKRKLAKTLTLNDIVPQLNSKEPKTIRRAFRQLKMLGRGASSAKPALAKLLTNNDESIRLPALFVLVAISERPQQYLSQLTAALNAQQPTIRLRAIHQLAALGSQAKTAVPALLGRLNDPDQAVADAALDAVKIISGQ